MKGVLEVKGASVVYLEGTPFVVKALDDVSLTLRPGEFLGLVGNTGSGKSTLVQAINGLIPLAGGTVEYPEGYDRKRLFERIGLVFQQPEDQLFERSVAEDVAFGPTQLGLEGDEVRSRVDRALRAVGLDPGRYRERNPLELSGGEKRRVAIAGILSMEPDLLVLDEPTAGLDQVGRDLLLGSLRGLHRSRQLTVVVISHDMDMLAGLATRLVVLHRGRLVRDDTPARAFGDAELLTTTGLRAPLVVDLAARLRARGLDLGPVPADPAEAGRLVAEALRRRTARRP